MEKKLRVKLEEEVRDLREEGGGGETSGNSQNSQDTEILIRRLSQAEEKVSPIVYILEYCSGRYCLFGGGGGGEGGVPFIGNSGPEQNIVEFFLAVIKLIKILIFCLTF